ncbi:unnamed protein product, partial [marine sediment metagenome]
KLDFYKLRGILPVVRSWPKRLKTAYTSGQKEAWAVFGILSKSTTLIQDKVREAWIAQSFWKKA